jgi:hypothetical protein
MGFLVIGLVVVGTVGAIAFRQSWHKERVERLRDRARLKVIEGQMTMLRTALRISAAEQATRRRMHKQGVGKVISGAYGEAGRGRKMTAM